jgi:hypothetical protein
LRQVIDGTLLAAYIVNKVGDAPSWFHQPVDSLFIARQPFLLEGGYNAIPQKHWHKIGQSDTGILVDQLRAFAGIYVNSLVSNILLHRCFKIEGGSSNGYIAFCPFFRWSDRSFYWLLYGQTLP